MRAALSRALMALTLHTLGEGRREWSAAMQAEFEAAVIEAERLPFAAGCLFAALRDLPAREEGRLTLTNHALALILMVPMAALQIGGALLDLPYLFPGPGGLPAAMLEGSAHEALMRSVYQAAIPSFALLLLLLGAGQLRMAWALLDRDWSRVARMGRLMLAAAITLIIFMSVFLLDCSQALLQAGVLAIELAIVSMAARWHAQLVASRVAEHPG